MVADKAEMWAVLCEPPEKIRELVDNLAVSPELKKKFNTTSFTWNTIDPDEVIRKFRIACVRYAQSAARAVQPVPMPDYWTQVDAACEQVIDALNGMGDLAAARAATAHAAAADDAAYTATAHAAAGAARAAARAATAATAHAAARAAAGAAYTAARAHAAASADLFEILIQIILAEYENRG
jgi:hypothetical protein